MNELKSFRLFITIAFLFFIHATAFSQHNTSSPYSRYGLGDITTSGYGQNQGMGGTCIGMQDPFHLNNGNPAALAGLPTHTFLFEIGASDRYSMYKTDAANQSKHSANIRYMALGFTFKSWWHSSVGINPASDVGYKIVESYLLDSKNLLTNTYSGTGGLNQTYWTNSFTLFKALTLGATASFLYGGIEYNAAHELQWIEYADNVAEISSSVLYNLKSSYSSGFLMNYGLQYRKIFNDKYVMVLGAVYTPKTKLNSKIQNTILRQITIPTGSLTDTLSDTEQSNLNVELPEKWGIGASINYMYKYIFSIDYSQQKWSDVQLWTEDNPMNKRLQDSKTIATGFQFVPNPASPRYFNSIRYRAGFHYTTTNLLLPNDNSIKDVGISLGVALPFNPNSSLININLEAGKRGSDNNSTIKEKYLTLSINFSLNDLWFFKRKIY